MIESTIIADHGEVPGGKYPYMGQLKEGETIVLFTSSSTGVRLFYPGKSVGNVCFLDNWIEEDFKMFNGTIELRNSE